MLKRVDGSPIMNRFYRQGLRWLTSQHPAWKSLDRVFGKMAGNISGLSQELLLAQAGQGLVSPNLLMSGHDSTSGRIIAPEFPSGIVTGKRGKYSLVSEFAEGGMAKIYLVKGLDQKFHLLKVMKDVSDFNLKLQAELRTRFKNEFLILARINDRHIPTLIDYDPGASPNFFVMEHIDGRSLFSLISDGKRVNPITSGLIISQVLHALIVFGQAVSLPGQEQFAHRDIKPENIVLELQNNRIQRVVLIDFGIAKLPRSNLTGASVFHGTPSYAAPEVFTSGSSIADQRSDNYALGAVLYWLLSGQSPFDFENQKQIFEFLRNTKGHMEKLERNRSNYVPDELWAIVFKAMEPISENRFQSYQEFKLSLDTALQALTPKQR